MDLWWLRLYYQCNLNYLEVIPAVQRSCKTRCQPNYLCLYCEILECQDSFFYPNEVAEQLYNFVKSGNFKQTKAIFNFIKDEKFQETKAEFQASKLAFRKH